MSTLGLGSVIGSRWLQPLAIILLLLSASALLLSARRRRSYGPFCLGLLAVVAMYLCKFKFDYAAGVYLSGVTLLGATVWNALPKRRAASDVKCHC
jgi:hypothetical protein